MRIFRITLAGIFICFLGLGLAIGQEKQDKSKNKKDPPGPVTIKANVTVLDAAGNLVNGLKAGDIKVFEDGVEQKITYFAGKGPVLNLGLVMDNSGSLRPQLKKLEIAGNTLVDSLTGEGEAFVVRFISSEKIEVIREWTSNKTKLNQALENMFIEGGQSAVIDALYLSAQILLDREKTDRSRKYAMVLVSDVEERDSYYELKDLLGMLKDSDIQIFVIALTGELTKNRDDRNQPQHPKVYAENLAQTIAVETGGNVFFLGKKYTDDDLKAVTKSISDELRYPYVIGYTSTNQNRDGTARKLRVEIADGEKGEKRKGSIRESFVVPKN
jgi:Ca-activated chloride channel family protein